MNKRFLLFLLLAILTICALPALAQEATPPPLECTAFEDSPNEVRVSYYMGEGAAFFSSSQLSSAVTSFSCAIQVDAAYVPAYLSRAIVYTQQRDYENALDDYGTALERDNDLLAAYNNRGIVYTALLDYDAALADFNRVLQIDGNNINGYTNRGVIYALRREYEQAIADLEQAIELSGIDEVVADLRDPERQPGEPAPEYDMQHARPYALLGIVYSAQALDQYRDYLLLTGGSGDQRIQSAAGSLESRFNFELRLDDGTWLLAADFRPGDQE